MSRQPAGSADCCTLLSAAKVNSWCILEVQNFMIHQDFILIKENPDDFHFGFAYLATLNAMDM